MGQRFAWDAAKAARNLKKHGVSFEEAVSAFADPLARIYDDPDHSASEKRAIIVGTSFQGALLVVGFTDRSDRVRIITARSPLLASVGIMKNTTTPQQRSDDLRPEYDFAKMGSRPNPFAARMTEPVVAVVLEPDVAQVFGTAEDVNRMLRSVISGLPRQTAVNPTKSRRKAG